MEKNGMKEFLRGWRRKWGVFVLAIAVGSVALWMRSHAVLDQIQFHSGPKYVQVIGTEPQGLILMTLSDVDGVLIIPQVFESKKQDFALTGLLKELSVRWTTNVGGLQYSYASEPDPASSVASEEQTNDAGHGGSKGVGGANDATELSMPINDPVVATRVAIIPYWPVTFGFTLLAAYLILCNPRSASPDAPQSTVASKLDEAKTQLPA